jgi:methionyl-tRNA formyltransferase
MKITIFTSNQPRHQYLVNLLLTISSELFVVQECRSIFPGLVPGFYNATEAMQEYFKEVKIAEKKFFKNNCIDIENKKIKFLPISNGDLNHLNIKELNAFLQSDVYIVFGSSFIKGELANFLVDNKAINIHMGVSPYYKGADCNFWALYDNNPHYVGATIHLLSKGLDSGPILYHALSNRKENAFEYSMSTVLSAFQSLKEKLEDKSIFKIKPQNQEHTKQIRYSKKQDFNDEVVLDFLKNKRKIKDFQFIKNNYKDFYLL